MNKRIKKKRKDVRKLEELESANAALLTGNRQLAWELAKSERELHKRRYHPTLCSHSIEPNYFSSKGVETHRLQVNAPLRIDHMGPLHESDVARLAGELAEALHKEAISQLMPHAIKGMRR